MEEICSVNGEVMPSVEAMVSATDGGLQRGDGVFEAVRLYRGRPYAIGEHLRRLKHSADGLRLEVDTELVASELDALLAQAGEVDALLRIIATRGGARLLFIEPLPPLPSSVRLATITYSPTRLLDGIKSLSYAANMLSTRIAKERGFDDALWVTPHGRVIEGPTFSFFWVSDGQLYTPPISERILPSITRARVAELVECEERECALDEFSRAQEVFLVSTVREVMPVSAVESYEFATTGSITERAKIALSESIRHDLGLE